MKKSLLAIALAAATMPLTFAQTPAPSTPSQPAPDQKSTSTKSTKKSKKHSSTKKTTGASAAPSVQK